VRRNRAQSRVIGCRITGFRSRARARYGQEITAYRTKSTPFWRITASSSPSAKARKPIGSFPLIAYAMALGIEHRLTKVNHPWTNGQVERMNRTIKEAPVKR
jgi:transposase InsO family protein